MWYHSVVGQNNILESLHESILSDTLSHAMIIEGRSGYGGLPIALSLAEHLLCTGDDKSKGCGKCKSCIQVQKLIHPDLHIVFPVVNKEGTERKNTTSKDFMPEWRALVSENPYISYNEWIRSIARKSANGDINVKECNEIIQQLNMQSFSGGRKIQIIWIADQLGANGNKLLKLIEEPPPNTQIILICDNIEFLLMTIVSRCRIIRLPRIDEEKIATALENQMSIDHDMAQKIAYICDGDFSTALEYVQLDQNNLMELCLNWASVCEKADLHQIRQWAIKFNQYNLEEQKAIVHYLLKILQALIYYQLLGKDHVRMSISDKTQLFSHAYLLRLDVSEIDQLKNLCSLMIAHLERYVNGRMVMFDACLTISIIFQQNKSKKTSLSTS